MCVSVSIFFLLLVLVDTEVCLVITPPPDDRSTLVLAPLDVLLLGVHVR